MAVADLAVALVAVLAGFAAGWAFRGWFARRQSGSTGPEGRQE
jgi:hypothetical protein